MSKRKTNATNANATNVEMFNDKMTMKQRDDHVARLIEKLRESNANNDRAMSKKIRRALRSLNHKGGLNERTTIDALLND